MKIIFAGTPEFAAVALEAIVNSSHRVIAVYTQPDRPAGRGLKLKLSAVKELAMQYQIPVYQPASLNSSYEEDNMTHLNADIMVVAAYSKLLPAKILHIPRLGCINIHPSLLPRWRGAAPIQRTVWAGDTISGVTIMQMDQGLDTGPILLQRRYVLDPEENSQTLHDQLAKLGAETLIETLNLLEKGNVESRPQNSESVSYAEKISKEEALIDWYQAAIELERCVRAFNPWPIAYTSWRSENLRIWQAKALAHDHNADPRTLLAASPKGIDIATGSGVLRLLKLQLPGAKVISASDFYNAHHSELVLGQHFV